MVISLLLNTKSGNIIPYKMLLNNKNKSPKIFLFLTNFKPIKYFFIFFKKILQHCTVLSNLRGHFI